MRVTAPKDAFKMSEITCLIVDDEEIARLRLHRLVSAFPEMHILGEAENGLDAVKKINELKPDLVFLDIQMPGLNGFEVLRKLSRQPVIIFTTAFDKFAIQAFDENSVAYLLKPVEKEKLSRAIDKSKALLHKTDKLIYEKLLQFVEKKNFTHFVSKFGAKVKLIPKEEVCYIAARDKYTYVHLANGSEYIIDQTLSQLESYIDHFFLRIHRGSIININFICEAEKAGDSRYLFTLTDIKKSQVQSSTSYASKIRKRLGI
jgi:two-component system LytT family response regulator